VRPYHSICRASAAALAVAAVAPGCTDPATTFERDALHPTAIVRAAVAPVALNAVTTVSDSTRTSMRLAHATSGGDRHLVVVLHHAGETARSVASLTYAGVPMTRVAVVANGPRITEMWHLVAPALGTNEVALTLTASARYLTITAISRTGVDQASPIGVPVTALNTTATPSVTVGAAAGSVVQDAVTWNRYLAPAASATPGPGQTAATNTSDAFPLGGATSHEAGGASVPMTWTLSASRAWSMIAVEIRQTTAPPADVTPPVLGAVTATPTSTTDATVAWSTDRSSRRSARRTSTRSRTSRRARRTTTA
jgi:hypothetical protein